MERPGIAELPGACACTSAYESRSRLSSLRSRHRKKKKKKKKTKKNKWPSPCQPGRFGTEEAEAEKLRLQSISDDLVIMM